MNEDQPQNNKIEPIAGFSGEVLKNEPLSKHVFYKVGGPADYVFVPRTNEDLLVLSQWIQKNSLSKKVLIIGLGSNLLVSDRGYRGVVIKTTRLPQEVRPTERGIWTHASTTVAYLIRRAAQEGWAGFEWMSGIPGTVGGVVAMNGGTHLGEAAQALIEYESLDISDHNPKFKITTRNQIEYSYRKNASLRPTEWVSGALWKFTPADPAAVRESLDALYRRRKETQPLDYPSCGSVFKNPEGTDLRAWQVIDRLGLRGFRIGNAQFAEKHPNWILNLGNASAQDILTLIRLAQDRALKELGIRMVPEVKTIGFEPSEF